MIIPEELRRHDTWINWHCHRVSSGKTTKIPCDPSGRTASVTGQLYTFEQAYDAYLKQAALGIGYVFTNNGVIGIDVDKATEDEIQLWSEQDTYVERSPSGHGVHIITKGVIPGQRRRNGRYEIYSGARFFTMTGSQLSKSTEIKAIDLQSFYTTYIEPKPIIGLETSVTKDRFHTQRVTDETLLQQLLLNDRFALLYAGYTHQYSSHSEAELAMCSIIAKYTQDMQLIDAIVQSSKLFRPKWVARRGNVTYGQLTIRRSLS